VVAAGVADKTRRTAQVCAVHIEILL
jgi:hypothetical protein